MANVLHIKNLQRRLDSQKVPIICIALHPGAVMTPNVSKFLDKRGSLSRPLWSLAVSMVFGPTRKGAMNSAYAAASPEVKAKEKTFKGVYLNPVGVIINPSPQAGDERLMNELYNTTLEIMKELNL